LKAQAKQGSTFFFIFFFFILFLSYIVLKPLLSLAIMAFIIVTIFNPVYSKLVRALKGRVSTAVTISILLIFLSVIIPVILLTYITYNQVITFNNDFQKFISNSNTSSEDNLSGNDNVDMFIDKINNVLGDFEFIDYQLSKQDIREVAEKYASPVAEFAANNALSIGKSTPWILTQIVVFTTLLSSLFPLQNRIKQFISKISPMDDEIDRIYIKKVLSMATSMVKGTLVIALAQGILSGLFLWIAGVNYVMFWTILSIFLSIIPVGAGLINIPIGIVMLLTGQIWQGILIILGNVLIVGSIDNLVIRPKMVSKDAQLHPALVLLGVIGGIQVFGFLGFIYGPVVMILLVTTLDIYIEYYKPSKRGHLN
jgi:predicted PurR-regulated permease PerM